MPFPFGFSGIYSDGGISSAPFQVTVWANGLLTFDPSVSFNPLAFPLNPVPSDCEFNEECEYDDVPPFGDSCEMVPTPLPAGAVSDTFGGFPFTGQYAPPTIPDALIAPWWGDLSLCPDIGQVGWLSTLDDNNLPMVVIQWTKASATPPESPPPPQMGNFFECDYYDFSSCAREVTDDNGEEGAFQLTGPGVLPTFTFQVRLHSNNDVDFVYGPSSNFNPTNSCFANAVGNCNYVSGIQSTLVYPNNAAEPPIASYSVEGVNCDPTAGCPQSQFPASGTSVTFADVFRPLGPDIQLTAMNPPRLLTQGGTATIPLTLSNAGGAPSHEGQVQFYFSAGGTTPEGGAFGLQNVPSYVSCQTVPFPAQVTVPTSVPQGGGYLIAELIPGSESVDGTHTFASSPVIIGPPEPDLAVEGGLGVTPVSVVGGQDITINFVAANVGEVDAPPTAYGIYVSLGGSISATGNQIFGGVLPALASGATIPITQSIQVPVSLVSGEYLIGVIVNPANTLDEVNLSNNIGLGKKLLNVTSPGPVITTTSLADARANTPYSIQLVAGGGDGIYQWSLLAGALPGGLALTRAGLINGQAEAVGSSTFTVKVTDGVGHNASAVFSLNVDPFEQVLTIETVDLPAGSTGQSYKFTIAAVGGAPPYQWALVSGAGSLPSGISLVSDGTLTGEPQYDGTSTFQVNVTDSNGQVVTSPAYALTVYAAGSLAVGSTQLGTAILNETYSGTLHYAGGPPPYTWSLISVDREPGYPGDPGQAFGPSLPAGLTFYGAQGQVEGTPAQVGVFALTVQVTDGEVPVPATAQGLVLLTVTSTTSFSFETVQLPPAVINQPYSTNLLTSPPSTPLPPNYAVTFNVINSAQLVTPNAIRTVPVGITVDPDGTVAGVPVQVGTFSFLVEATDTEGGVAEQSFTLQVTSAKPASSGGGCQSAPGAPALAGLVLLALTGVRRRSARRRSRARPSID